ncbi:hypothetical protein HDU77_003081 [Chytriomyces hyalinus]|nr:hypothetical protein HDU77_003081 [Chytriomyces hyalinus]
MSGNKSVAIIGAGISGLAAARHFLHDGWDVVLFDRSDGPDIGGVWPQAYDFVRLQNSSHHYHFADFPFPEKVDFNPTKAQLVDYFTAFARHYDISRRIRFLSEVVDIEARDGGVPGWKLTIVNKASTYREEYDFIVNAQGYFSIPKMPVVQGQDLFSGEIVHSSKILHTAAFKPNSKIVVVGTGKTALDFCVAAAGKDATVHQVVLTAHWTIPQYLLGFVHFNNAFFTRINTVMMPSWFHLPFEAKLHRGERVVSRQEDANWDPILNCAPLVAVFWQMVQFLIAFSSGWRSDDALYPKHSILKDMRNSISVLPAEYNEMVRKNRIQVHSAATISRVSEKEVYLSDGSVIDNVDLIVMATGYDSSRNCLVPTDKIHLVEEDGIYLYKHVVHPDLPNMCFATAHSVMLLASVDMSLHLATSWLRGEAHLPSREQQLAEIDRVRAWKRVNFGSEPHRALSVLTRFQQYLDEICVELGVNPMRKVARLGWWNPYAWIKEFLGWYVVEDYEFYAIRKEIATAHGKRQMGCNSPVSVEE